MESIKNGTEEIVEPSEFLQRVTGVPDGQIQAMRLRNPHSVQVLIEDHLGTHEERRFIFFPLRNVITAVEGVSQLNYELASLVRSAWPFWFGDRDFGWYRDDPLGNERLYEEARDLALSDDRVTPSWVIQAVHLAAGGALPIMSSLDSAAQVAQGCLALSRHGIVFLIPFEPGWIPSERQSAVSVVEWLARNSGAAVIPLIPMEWAESDPVDRLLFRAWTLAESDVSQELGMGQSAESAHSLTGQMIRTPGMSRVMGSPHPLSEVEKRVWAYLTSDPDMAQLFRCNQTVITVLGTRPRVDLLWPDGRIVVELDGYADHGMREAFERDRHRDYELLMSGYQVLRITNDEIHRDFEAAIGKIRDLVGLKKSIKSGEQRQ